MEKCSYSINIFILGGGDYKMSIMYSIGKAARKSGKSVKTLQNWDKKGILVAKRSPTNRRQYTHEQVLQATCMQDVEEKNIIDNSVVFITGSGTLATAAIDVLHSRVRKLVIYSRDEHKHRKLRAKFPNCDNIRYVIGDVKDREKITSSMRGADICIHTAALKMIETGFYSADEVVRVNTVGSMNVASAAIDAGVSKALFISSDKACNPLNGLTYGLSKSLAESAWLSYNNHSTRDGTVLFATRYGNVINSANSFYDILEEQKRAGKIKITSPDMSRFYFTIEEAMALNMFAIEDAIGGEIYIPKLKSAKLMTFVEAFASGYETEIIGMRGTEKLAEEMIASYEMPYTYPCVVEDEVKYFKVVPEYINSKNMGWDLHRAEGDPVKPFVYTSDSDDIEKLSADDLVEMIKCG